MSARLVVVADDLTGAADTAAAYGPDTEVAVVLSAEELPPAEVVAVDTDTRHCAPEEAAAPVAAAVRLGMQAGAALYKKIDSTLRGNIAVELSAALGALRSDGLPATALLAPAFPATGRTVVDGVLRVNGTALPDKRGGGDLQALFHGSRLRTASIGLELLRQGPATVARAFADRRIRGADVICCDAVTDEDLRILHDASVKLGPGVLPVGSAGLIRVAVRGHSPEIIRPRRRRFSAEPSVLTVVGSCSDVAREQYQVLTAAPGVRTIVLDDPFGATERATAAATLHGLTQDALLVPDPDAPVNRERAAEVAAAIGEVGGRLLIELHERLAGLVLTGGETARAVLLAAGVRVIDVLGELEPGIVLSTIPALDDLPLITKAGAFGDAGTLDRARCLLHELSTTSSTVH
jgi:uncharacterized protein YgbK (DUF1537 family)